MTFVDFELHEGTKIFCWYYVSSVKTHGHKIDKN